VATNRRTRISAEVGTQLRAWLVRVTRVHAHLLTIVRLYGRPDRAGGGGHVYADKVAAGDRTLLSSCLTHAICELSEIRDEVDREIDDVEPVEAFPGSREKLAAMRERITAGLSLFSARDTHPDQEELRRVASK